MTRRSSILSTTRKEDDFIGTINPEALKLPALQNKNKPSPYEQLAKLSAKADYLRKEIMDAQEKLSRTINSDKPTPFCTFKKWLNEFEERTAQREAELNVFAKHLTSFRTNTDPTFVEVDASDEKTPNFDAYSYSLLVSNQQRNFFSKEDIAQQNNELKILIYEQQEAISNLRSRLKLFVDFQSQNAIQHTIQSLKQGCIPMALSGAAPTRATELRAKQKLLSKQLVLLVKKRKVLLKAQKVAKLELRQKRMINSKAIIIQKVFRGHLERQQMRKLAAAAVKIQKHVRGYLIRFQQHEAMNQLITEENRISSKRSMNSSANTSQVFHTEVIPQLSNNTEENAEEKP